MKRDYRTYYRIFLILFLLSFSANLLVLTLYLKERVSWPTFWREGKETQPVQEAKMTKGMGPVPVIHVKNKEYFLLCEKNRRTLSLYRSEQNAFSLIKSYPCIVGSNNGDKRKAGDLATPEDIYFLISFQAGEPFRKNMVGGLPPPLCQR